MRCTKIFDNLQIGDELFATKSIDIKWGSMRFYNAHIEPVTYTVRNDKKLDISYRPKGVGGFPTPIDQRIYTNLSNLYLFSTKEEAEIWKLLEWNNIEERANEHFEEQRKKIHTKIKKIKHTEKLNDYIEKYPDKLIKVM